MTTQQIWIWRYCDTGQIAGSQAFCTKEQAIKSMKFASHNMEEFPTQLKDSIDAATGEHVEVWNTPSRQGKTGVLWTRLSLSTINLYNEVVHL